MYQQEDVTYETFCPAAWCTFWHDWPVIFILEKLPMSWYPAFDKVWPANTVLLYRYCVCVGRVGIGTEYCIRVVCMESWHNTVLDQGVCVNTCHPFVQSQNSLIPSFKAVFMQAIWDMTGVLIGFITAMTLLSSSCRCRNVCWPVSSSINWTDLVP
jgi:hypothetical protein